MFSSYMALSVFLVLIWRKITEMIHLVAVQWKMLQINIYDNICKLKENERTDRRFSWDDITVQRQGKKNTYSLQRPVTSVCDQEEWARPETDWAGHPSQRFRGANSPQRGRGGACQKGNRWNRARTQHGGHQGQKWSPRFQEVCQQE